MAAVGMVLLTILKIVGWVLLLLLVLLAVLLLAPACVWLKYERETFSVSVGMLGGEALLDLCYVEDKDAEVDMNLVMTDRGEFVEVQGSGEEAVFTADQMSRMLELGRKGLEEIAGLQRQVIADADKPDADALEGLSAFFGSGRQA